MFYEPNGHKIADKLQHFQVNKYLMDDFKAMWKARLVTQDQIGRYLIRTEYTILDQEFGNKPEAYCYRTIIQKENGAIVYLKTYKSVMEALNHHPNIVFWWSILRFVPFGNHILTLWPM